MTAGQRNSYLALSDLLSSYTEADVVSALLAAMRERLESEVGPVHDCGPIRHKLRELVMKTPVAE